MREDEFVETETKVRDERLFFKPPDLVPLLDDKDVISPSPERFVKTPPKTNHFTDKGAKKLSIARCRTWLVQQIEIEIANDILFLLIPVLIIAGSATYFSLSVEPAAHNIPVALAILLALRMIMRRSARQLRLMLNALMIFVFAMGLGQARTYYLSTPMLGSEVSTTVTGRIVRIEKRPNESVRYTIDVLSTERPRLRYAPERVRATARKPLENAQVGGGISGFVRLRPPSGPARPNGFDFAFYNYFQKLGANGFFLGAPRNATIAPPNGWQAIWITIEKGRHWLGKRIRSHNQDTAGAVAAALITGDKAGIPEHINEVLRRSGLAHILSISGLHMALVAGTIMFALRLAMAFSPATGAKRPTKKLAALAGFAAIAIYLFLAGASVATQRSFIMLAVMLGALMSDRAALTMRNLAIAAIIVCLLSPDVVLGPSFQMSFSATLALIAAYGSWQARRKHTEYIAQSTMRMIATKSGSFLGGLSMTSIIAGTATGIFAAYHFQRVAMFGLLGNLAAMPIVSLITMPFAIIGTLLIPVGLDGYAFAVMNWSIDLVIMIATAVSDISPDGHTGAMSTFALITLTTSLFCLCILKSNLRLIAIPFILIVALTGTSRSKPDFVISEDARLVAAIGNDRQLRVNRKRPSSFIMEQWSGAYRANKIILPDTEEEGAFQCENKSYCTFSLERRGEGISLHWVADPKLATDKVSEICKPNNVVVLAYAPSADICKGRGVTMETITAQNLALYGSAEIYLNDKSGDPESTIVARVVHAIKPLEHQANLRPWHRHRQYSRSARNLEPNKPR